MQPEILQFEIKTVVYRCLRAFLHAAMRSGCAFQVGFYSIFFFFTALLLPDKPNAQQFAWQMYAGKSQRITVRGYGTAVCFHRKY